MKQTGRINQDIRLRIRQWIKQNAFTQERAKLLLEEHQLVEAYRVAHNGGQERSKYIDSLEPGVCNTTMVHYTSHTNWRLPEPRNWRVQAHEALTSDVQKAFGSRFEDLRLRKNALNTRIDALIGETDKVLMQAVTIKRACEILPEFTELLTEYIPAKDPPAKPISDVRDLLCAAGVIRCDEQETTEAAEAV